MNRILVTGATGFVGRFLCHRLLAEGWRVRGTMLASETPASFPDGVDTMEIEPLGVNTAWEQALEGIDTIIHLAARVHVMKDTTSNPLQEFRKVNLLGTERLALQAARAGVKRLVYISTIKVMGEENVIPYCEDSPFAPRDPYGISKAEAETALWHIAEKTRLEVVIIRPPIVYGPGVKANFRQLLSIVSRGVPLPFASISNKRSLVFVKNLVDALACCAVHPSAVGQTYLVSDGLDVSTPELIRQVASALGTPARLFPFPPGLLRLAGRMMGKSSVVERLAGPLQVDSSKIERELGWKPPFTMEEGLRETAEWFKKIQHKM